MNAPSWRSERGSISVEVAVTTWCVRDLKDRPQELVRGPKILWAPALSVQPLGPIAYLVWGRRR